MVRRMWLVHLSAAPRGVQKVVKRNFRKGCAQQRACPSDEETVSHLAQFVFVIVAHGSVRSAAALVCKEKMFNILFTNLTFVFIICV